MGHAGAFALPGEPSTQQKVEALEAAGVTIVNHPEKFGVVLKQMLNAQPTRSVASSPFSTGQRRFLHAGPGMSRSWKPARAFSKLQRRFLYLTQMEALKMIRAQDRGLLVQGDNGESSRRLLAIGIDRSTRSPCVIASPSIESTTISQATKRFSFDYRKGVVGLNIEEVAKHMSLDNSSVGSLQSLISGLAAIFYREEAFLLVLHIVKDSQGDLAIVGARFGFDDKRQTKNTALGDSFQMDPVEKAAASNGIVYIKLPGDGSIGTLVNGAGLAMNTIDALADLGGKAANFLDTGGLATSETIKKSFEAILQDSRVRVVFLNVFGGLTLGDMIARGVLLAFKEIDLKVPVVVRIRGTAEQEGQNIIAESGLPLFAFDGFQEAAEKVIELSQNGSIRSEQL
jgi:succinyl-CoA synthetase alpha subunit